MKSKAGKGDGDTEGRGRPSLSPKIFRRINQRLTTIPEVFLRTPLAAPKTHPTFAVPKRQTDYGAQRSKSLEQNFENVGTPALIAMSITCDLLKKSLRKIYFSNSLQIRKEQPYLCNPLQKEAAKLEKAERKNIKFFRLKLDK
ncbi:hypothetical protein [Hymenobacter sp. B1770]|uniref:hypothetical protein n=1 Tax=Hymenobacter sp. B1770 TaxID=1718788 RepID=UPI003CF7AE19